MKLRFTIVLITLLLTTLSYNLKAQCLGDTFSMHSDLFGYPEVMGVSDNGDVVTGHMGGITIYDGTSWTKHTVADAHQLGSIDIDENGKIYLGINWTGFMVWENPSTYTLYDTNDGLHSLEMEGVTVAPDGKVWIGSFGDGCAYFDGNSFTKFNTSNGLPDNFIVGFDFDQNGNVYMANYNGSVIIYDGTNFTNLIPPNVNEVNGITLDGKGGFWIIAYSAAGGNRLVHYDGSTWNSVNFPMSTFPSSIECDLSGNVWVGAWNGCFKYDGNRWKVYTTSEGLYDNQVNGLGINNFDEVWISGGDGISRLGEYSSIKGTINANAIPITDGYVKLFRKTEGIKKIIQYDSVSISGMGDYDFSNVLVGTYLIYAVGDPALYGGFTGTYYGDVELWSVAEAVNVAFCDTIYATTDIKLIEKIVNPPGKGYISGHVKSADGTRAGSEPIKDVDVTLKKVPGGVVKQTKTDPYGFFEFESLSNGIYGIIIDMPGLELDTIRSVEITDTDTTHTGQDYEVDSTGIHAGDFSSIDDDQNIVNSVVYPNPANGLLHIHFSNSMEESIQIDLINVNGQTMYSNTIAQKGELTEQINISNYARGMYLLKLQGGKSMKIVKVLMN